MPLSTKSGRASISASTASITQSVGVPSTCHRRSARWTGRTGWCSVSEWLVALCSRSGATTLTSPSGSAASMRDSIPWARIPSSFVMRKRINSRRLVGGSLFRREVSDEVLQFRLERLESLDREGGSRSTAKLTSLPMLIHFLARALDGVLLGVQEVLHKEDELDLATLIHSITRPILRRVEKAELAFPVAEHVRLQVGELADLADAEEFLDRLCSTHASCSDRSSRAISSATAVCAEWPSNRMRCTISTIGISTPSLMA